MAKKDKKLSTRNSDAQRGGTCPPRRPRHIGYRPAPNGWLRRMQSPYPSAASRPQAQAVITGSRRLLRGHDAPAGWQVVAHKYGARPHVSVPVWLPSLGIRQQSAPWPPTQLSPPRASPPAPGCTAGRRPGRYVVTRACARVQALLCRGGADRMYVVISGRRSMNIFLSS